MDVRPPGGDDERLAATLERFFRDPGATAFPPLDSPFTDQLLAGAPAGDPRAALAAQFARDGFLQIDLELADFEERAARIVRALAPRYAGSNRRIQEAWTFQPDVRALACLPQVLHLLQFLYQRRPIPFQTLNFEVGTEQATHSDVVHFHSFPRRYMCGVWIALEDVDAGNGPLHYYPGSHRLPEYDFHDLGMARGFEDYGAYEHFIAALVHAHRLPRVELHARKGTALIWAANLLHGGSAVQRRGSTRHSQVTHYYFEGCLAWEPGDSDALIGDPRLREVIDLSTGRFVPPVYHGRPLDLARFARVYRYPRPLPDWVGEPAPARGPGS
jgi:hypothetical protein